MKKVMIYGTGQYGKSLYKFLKDMEINIFCFLETETSFKKEYDGIPILPINIFSKSNTDNVVILLAIKNSKECNDIRLMLIGKYRIRNNQIIICANFIENNNLSKEQEGYCILCGSYVNRFLPAGIQHEIFKRHHIIGGGFRNNCICEKCGSSDRERWLYYVLNRYTKIFNNACSVLHFAPENVVKKVITIQNPSCQYFTADIIKGCGQYIVDMTSISFEDESFDYIIANHVLEHIVDEQKAICELKRVLKINGKLILSFPICMDMNTLEDPTITTEEERLNTYGQIDHVRLYGRDYVEHIEKYGLNVQVVSPYMEFNENEINELKFIKDDIILMCTRL